jgi:hypothetical protein
MGLEKNRFKVRAKPFNNGSIIFDLFFTPSESPATWSGDDKKNISSLFKDGIQSSTLSNGV